jgi:hypothetical protein
MARPQALRFGGNSATRCHRCFCSRSVIGSRSERRAHSRRSARQAGWPARPSARSRRLIWPPCLMTAASLADQFRFLRGSSAWRAPATLIGCRQRTPGSLSPSRARGAVGSGHSAPGRSGMARRRDYPQPEKLAEGRRPAPGGARGGLSSGTSLAVMAAWHRGWSILGWQ